ncbi:putative collagen-binding domain-containing protein, partial [Planctomycetota bacterium]
KWTYRISFHQGELAALNGPANAKVVSPFDGTSGVFTVGDSDKTGRDLRAQGRLKYVGKRYLQFAESGRYFLKVGADAPETLLAYADFDNTIAGNPRKAPVKTWGPHVGDWKAGDPTWKDGKGKGLIGAINYLSGKGCNAFSFLTYNAGGDGDNVWPFIHRDDKLHYDCSKLDQWGTVFEHGTKKGMYLHFKMQETENDNHDNGYVPESLDGGELGAQRKLYCRELIARFGHNLALNWNLGEENTQSTAQQKGMIDYIAQLDPYDHNIVVHTYPNQQDKVYRPMLGEKSRLTGVSLQNSSLKTTHAHTEKWVRESTAAGKPWIVAFDESGSAAHAQSPDLGYRGFDGHDRTGKMAHTQHEVRKQTLWGNLMAGGAGCEYYFGYQFAENDIVCEDWRSRDQSWDYCRIAVGFFHDNKIPFWQMKCMDELVGNPDHGIAKFCFAKPDDTYLVYLPNGGTSNIDLAKASGDYSVQWFNPRAGGPLSRAEIKTVRAGGNVALGLPPLDNQEDWLIVLRRK